MTDLFNIGGLRPSNNKIGLMGHSMLGRCINVETYSAPTRTVSLNWERNVVAALSMLTKGRYAFPESCKFAVSGSTVKDIYTTTITTATNTTLTGSGTQLSYAKVCPAAVIYLDTSTNDVTAGYSIDRIITGAGDDSLGLQYVVDELVKAGKIVVLSSGYPRGNSSFTSSRLTTSQLKVAMAYRKWVLETAPARWPGAVYGIDYWSLLADRAAGTAGDIKAGYVEDGLHLNSAAGLLMYPRALEVFDRLGLPQSYPLQHQLGDIYDATLNPNGNLLINNPDLLGGTAISGTTGGVTLAGVRPTNHTVTFGSALQAGTGITLTGSQQTGTSTGDWYRIAYTGTTASNINPYFSLQLGMTGVTANINAGDIIAPFGEWEIGSGSTGVCGVSIRVVRTFPTGVDTIKIGYGDYATFGGVLDASFASANLGGTWNGDLRLQPWLGTETALAVYLDVFLRESSTPAGYVQFRNAALRKVV